MIGRIGIVFPALLSLFLLTGCDEFESTSSSTDNNTNIDDVSDTAPDDGVSTNRAPVISGTPPASIQQGHTYSFTPTADDADGDSLSFSVSNLPSWAGFDTQTGAITGQPQETDVGSYVNIVVTVSDGELTASMSGFDIEVLGSQVEIGSLSLGWTAPVTRTDGTRLEISEIHGYYIYLGETADSMQRETDLIDGQASSFTIDNLPFGTYFVALTVYDVDSNESPFSNSIEVTIGD